METYTIGTYNLFNTSITLMLELRFFKVLWDGEYNYGVEMKIPLPANYPPTTIGTSQQIKNKGLFEARISFVIPNSSFWNDIISLSDTDPSSIISLDAFYNVGKFENIFITPEENLLFAGLGKRFLCLAFPHILDHCGIELEDTLIRLDASGGAIRNNNDRIRVQQYIPLSKNMILQIYQNKYPEDFENNYDLFEKYSDLELVEALVSLENNEKLIHYYTTAFGFEILDWISMATLMATSLEIFLAHCKI